MYSVRLELSCSPNVTKACYHVQKTNLLTCSGRHAALLIDTMFLAIPNRRRRDRCSNNTQMLCTDELSTNSMDTDQYRNGSLSLLAEEPHYLSAPDYGCDYLGDT